MPSSGAGPGLSGTATNGRPRISPDSPKDVVLAARPGDRVRARDPLAIVHAGDDEKAGAASQEVAPEASGYGPHSPV